MQLENCERVCRGRGQKLYWTYFILFFWESNLESSLTNVSVFSTAQLLLLLTYCIGLLLNFWWHEPLALPHEGHGRIVRIVNQQPFIWKFLAKWISQGSFWHFIGCHNIIQHGKFGKQKTFIKTLLKSIDWSCLQLEVSCEMVHQWLSIIIYSGLWVKCFLGNKAFFLPMCQQQPQLEAYCIHVVLFFFFYSCERLRYLSNTVMELFQTWQKNHWDEGKLFWVCDYSHICVEVVVSE